MSRHPRAGDDTEAGFLSRWSRRKRRTEDSIPEDPGAIEQRAELVEEPAPTDATPPAEEHPAEEEKVKTDEDMPDLELIDETTDMSDFFSPGVSQGLRNRALQRLFHLAKFNVTDGLDDYCGDFRNYQSLGDIVTADMRHRMEVARQRLAEAGEAEPEQAPEPEDDSLVGDDEPAVEQRADTEEPEVHEAAEQAEADSDDQSEDPAKTPS